MKEKAIPVLNHVLMQLVLRRLFLPLLIIWVAAIGGVGYFFVQTLVSQQQQTLGSMVKMIDRHLDQGGRILDAVARVAEVMPGEDKTIFMQSTWEAYQHFDTIYYLDKNSKIQLMIPANPMYLGLDMSNLPDFQSNQANPSVTISRPFISLRTGAPTVYLIRPLSRGGCVVGELSLATFQNEIARDQDTSEPDSIFILDQAGTLLAHPVSDLVKQQTNLSYLDIFNKGLAGEVTAVYEYGETTFLGSATKVPRVGWVIVDQIPLGVLLRPYAMTFGVTIIVMLGVWLTLVWNLRKELEKNVVAPLVTLSQSTEALAIGDYSKVSVLNAVPTTFIELNQLVTDFQRMSTTLQIRQRALSESEQLLREANEQLEIKVEMRTQDLLGANEELQAMNEELQQTLDFLQKTQTQLVQSEKMASLGSLVAGVSHEINTPLGVGVTAVSHLKQLTDDLSQLYKNNNLKQADLVDYIADANEAVTIIYSNLERAAALVRSFKQVSVDQSSEAKRVFNVKSYMDEILLSLQPLLRKTRLKVKVECPEDLHVDGYPGAVAQIGTNLIMNSVIHAYEPDSEGIITITIKENEQQEICFIYSDDGKGMDDKTAAKIFDPFFTTKRGSGSGLGLYILYNIVTQQLGGTIQCVSQPGKGVTFSICWPLQ